MRVCVRVCSGLRSAGVCPAAPSKYAGFASNRLRLHRSAARVWRVAMELLVEDSRSPHAQPLLQPPILSVYGYVSVWYVRACVHVCTYFLIDVERQPLWIIGIKSYFKTQDHTLTHTSM